MKAVKGSSVVIPSGSPVVGLANEGSQQVLASMPPSEGELGTLAEIYPAHGESRPGPALDVSHLTVQFGGIRALDDVTITIAGGEVLAVIGPNGAGKSSLINAICGTTQAAKGDVHAWGERLTGRGMSRIAHMGIRRSFQDPPLVDAETVLENVLAGLHTSIGYGVLHQFYAPRRLRNCERAARDRVRGVLTFLGISHVEDVVAAQLPYGLRKLVDVARAIVSGPDILLLDEPTSGLDKSEQSSLAQTLRSLSAFGSGPTILIVEHHMDVVGALADRVVVLEAGSVAAEGKVHDILLQQTE